MMGSSYVFRTAHSYHLNALLEQLLKDAGLSADWKDAILPLVKKVSQQVQAKHSSNTDTTHNHDKWPGHLVTYNCHQVPSAGDY